MEPANRTLLHNSLRRVLKKANIPGWEALLRMVQDLARIPQFAEITKWPEEQLKHRPPDSDYQLLTRIPLQTASLNRFGETLATRLLEHNLQISAEGRIHALIKLSYYSRELGHITQALTAAEKATQLLEPTIYRSKEKYLVERARLYRNLSNLYRISGDNAK